jgi:hypothetical protein
VSMHALDGWKKQAEISWFAVTHWSNAACSDALAENAKGAPKSRHNKATANFIP